MQYSWTPMKLWQLQQNGSSVWLASNLLFIVVANKSLDLLLCDHYSARSRSARYGITDSLHCDTALPSPATPEPTGTGSHEPDKGL